MRLIGQSAAEAPPADQAARPVALTGFDRAHEGLVSHRLLALPVAFGIAIVGDAGIGADTGAGQDEKAPMPIDERLEVLHWSHNFRWVVLFLPISRPFQERNKAMTSRLLAACVFAAICLSVTACGESQGCRAGTGAALGAAGGAAIGAAAGNPVAGAVAGGVAGGAAGGLTRPDQLSAGPGPC